MQQFVNLSSWREDNIEIKAGECYQLSFIDTKPNMFYIQNPNYCKLNVSISKIPTATNYEFLINENSSEPLGRPIQTGYLYLLNTGTVTANVKVYSIADKFDMNILKNFTVQLDGVTLEASENIGFKDGVSLPSGTNNIGVVSLESAPTENLKTIADNSTEINKALDSSLLAIKNNVVGCADNSRDILWQLDGRTEVTGEKRQLVKEIADGIKAINDEGIGAQINGDVYLDKDIFWKKETSFKIIEKTLPLPANEIGTIDGYIKVNNLVGTGFTINNDYWEITTTGNPVPNVFAMKLTRISDTKNVSLAPYIGSLVSITEEEKAIKIADLFNLIKTNFYTSKTGPYYGESSFHVAFSSDTKTSMNIVKCWYNSDDISGILYAMNRITDFEFSDTISVGASTTSTICPDCAEYGEKMWDRIEMIEATDDSLSVKIYFTPTDYITVKNTKSVPIKNLNMTVYCIQLINSSTSAVDVTMLGGKF